MVKIRFQLKKVNGSGVGLIVVSVCFGVGGERVRFSSGESVDPSKWDAVKQRARRGYRFEKSVNDRLAFVEVVVKDEYGRLVNGGIAPTAILLRERIEERLRPRRVRSLLTIWEGFDAHKEAHAATFAAGTLVGYAVVRKHLKAFAEAYRLNLSWETLTVPFFEKFANYLLTVRQVSNTTLWKQIKALRAFLKWVEEQGVSVNADYKRFTKKGLPKGERSRKVYLSPEELELLWVLDLVGDARLASVRDVFLFHCYTGLRFSDGQLLRPEHRKGDVLHFVTGKNRKAVAVPLHPRAGEILRRWECTLPKISNRRFNDYLKEVCRLAGMDAPEIDVSYSGSKRIERTVSRWELVSSHTAKRTAVTNLLLSGKVSLDAICAVTGNSLKTIQAYVVPTTEDIRKQVEAAWGEND